MIQYFVKGGVNMNLDIEFKIQTAKDLTVLALQNDYILKYSSSEETAQSVCTFFKTLIANLDDGDK